MTNQERAAEVIWEEQRSGIVKPRDLVDALAEAGLLMPDLPEPMRIITPTWVKFSDHIDVCDNKVRVYFADNYGEDPEIMTPDEARSAAIDLIAAANLAEKSTNG